MNPSSLGGRLCEQLSDPVMRLSQAFYANNPQSFKRHPVVGIYSSIMAAIVRLMYEGQLILVSRDQTTGGSQSMRTEQELEIERKLRRMIRLQMAKELVEAMRRAGEHGELFGIGLRSAHAALDYCCQVLKEKA